MTSVGLFSAGDRTALSHPATSHGRSQTVSCLHELSRWFKVFDPRPQAALRLICLPHAGGAASAYHHWGKQLGDKVELVAVQLPGREERLHEPLIDDMTALIDLLSQAMRHKVDKPYVLFGHSMGAAIGYELCQALRGHGLPLPLHFIASGREAPQLSRSGTLHVQGEEALWQELIRLDPGMHHLLQYPELKAILLPIIFNDYRLIGTYSPSFPVEPLSVPVSVFTGDQDEELLPGDAEAWQAMTDQMFQVHVFKGRHFFIRDDSANVLNSLRVILDGVKRERCQA